MSPRLTAIGSGKGGTGKTFVATSLASALARLGERVLLCDADVGLSNTQVHLGLATGGDLADLLYDRVSLADAVVPVCEGSQSAFDLLAAPAGTGALANLEVGVVEGLMRKLRASQYYDRILIDLSAGVDARTMAMAGRSDDVLLVLNADPAALTDAYAFTKLLLKQSGQVAKSIVNSAENVADARRTAGSLAKTCRAFLKMEPQFLGFIPRDPNVVRAVRLQRLVGEVSPAAPAAAAILALARRLSARDVQGATRAGLSLVR